MNTKVKWFAIAAAFVLFIAGAAFLYNRLGADYKKDNFTESKPSGTQSSASDENKTKAPDFTVTDYAGNKVKLSDYFGKPIVVNFWASWCYYCKKEMPAFNKAFKEHGDVQFLMINVTDGSQETVQTAKAYIDKGGYEFPVFFDTELSAASEYQVSGLPITYFIDKDGNITAHGNGMLDEQTLQKGIDMIKNR